MNFRLNQRNRFAEEVTISGVDSDGNVFEQQAKTIDVTNTGARIEGVRCPLYRGAIVNLRCRSMKAKFRVRWVGAAGSALKGQVGIQTTEKGTFDWGKIFPHYFEQAESNVDRRPPQPSNVTMH